METIFLTIITIAMLVVFAIDMAEKRHTYLSGHGMKNE